MSTFSQFAGGGGGATIKAIQRGVISISPGNTSATATITAVDTAKTELRYLGGSGLDQNAYAAVPRVVLTNTTTITATMQYINGITATIVSWELTEYN